MSALTFEQVNAVNRERCSRWHGDDASRWSGADWSNAMCGEAGETANVVKKLRRIETHTADATDGHTEAELMVMLANEIADVFLYLDLLANYYDIDLPDAVVRKFNAVSERRGFPERLP